MICQRCLLRSFRAPSLPIRRTITTTSSNAAAAAAAAPTQSSSTTPPSSSATQPFTTPPSISPTSRNLPAQKSKKSGAAIVQSSCVAGTPLRGLNFMKGGADPVAMEDSEYPDWLWDILRKKKKEEEGVDPDLFSKSRAKRQKAIKRARKAGILNPEAQMPRVPLQEQSVDLPAGDGTLEGALQAGEARDDLTKAMRNKRRASIKEDNFLRTMS